MLVQTKEIKTFIGWS